MIIAETIRGDVCSVTQLCIALLALLLTIYYTYIFTDQTLQATGTLSDNHKIR